MGAVTLKILLCGALHAPYLEKSVFAFITRRKGRRFALGSLRGAIFDHGSVLTYAGAGPYQKTPRQSGYQDNLLRRTDSLPSKALHE
jgi:hypothetical protein